MIGRIFTVCLIALAHGQERPMLRGAIKLTLLRPLESGKSKVNANVPFVVATDVVDGSGAVMIAKGSYAVGTVVASRAEGPLSAAVFDRPARLAIRFDFVFDAQGNPLPIVASRQKPKEPLRLSRDYTAAEFDADQRVAQELKDAKHRQLLEKLVSVLSEGGFNPTKTEAADLERILANLELQETAGIIREGKLQELLATMRRLTNARTSRTLLANTSFKAVPSALNAVSEVVKLGTRGVGFLKGRLKGRNIRAFPGCDFTAFLAGS